MTDSDISTRMKQAVTGEPPVRLDLDTVVTDGRRQRRRRRALLTAGGAGVLTLAIGAAAITPTLFDDGPDDRVTIANPADGDPATSANPSATPADPLAGKNLSGASAAQAAEIADRVVTDAEYRAAFDRYRSCMQESHGTKLGTPTEWHGALFWTITDMGPSPKPGSDTVERCYPTEYVFVETIRLFAMEDSPETTKMLRECLQYRGLGRNGGLPLGETRTELNEQMEMTGPNLGTCEMSRQRLGLPPLIQEGR